MAKYEWYVVTTKRPDKRKLSEIREKLCAEYGGLTVIKNCAGYWLNGNLIESDKVEIWRCLTDKIVLPSEAITIGEQLCEICGQKEQLLTCNDKPYFVKAKPQPPL